YCWGDLELLTNSFSEENFIGNEGDKNRKINFGKVYRGKTQQGQEVTVKIWLHPDVGRIARQYANYGLTRLESECIFLTHPDVVNHPNLVKLIGYCCEVEDHHFGVVYDLRSKDTLINLTDKDDLTWKQRMQVASAIARVLEHLHCQNPPYLLHFVHPALIMLDQDFNPVLFDFFFLTGGALGEKQYLLNQDVMLISDIPYLDNSFFKTGKWGPRADQFSFAIVLIELICKHAFGGEKWKYDDELPELWAWVKYKHSGFQPVDCPLVHESLKREPGFHALDGVAITKLIFRCVVYHQIRPTMSQIVQFMEGLRLFTGGLGGTVLESLLDEWDADESSSVKKKRGCFHFPCLVRKKK
ncbi:putative serine/threonine-protein kinase PBL21, partial [Castanea sativa]|uniref:putative serine/threonine-protein kinase PBL21 n=1 Tax=Castanea sativa TaxID=21020 RepID=UPI003F64EE6B